MDADVLRVSRGAAGGFVGRRGKEKAIAGGGCEGGWSPAGEIGDSEEFLGLVCKR